MLFGFAKLKAAHKTLMKSTFGHNKKFKSIKLSATFKGTLGENFSCHVKLALNCQIFGQYRQHFVISYFANSLLTKNPQTFRDKKSSRDTFHSKKALPKM